MQKANTFYKNYELIDLGGFKKLESFSGIVVERPCPQADMSRSLPDSVWEEADAVFDGKEWRFSDSKACEGWLTKIDTATAELKLSGGGQIGIFPEQAANWKWIRDAVKEQGRPIKVLNGFAYTGLSTLFASSSNSSVCHLDGSKTSVTWAKKNAELSGLGGNDIRWIVDDVMTFLGREYKRGVKYDGFILDPPSFGRGKDGKTWSLKKNLGELLELCGLVLSPKPAFFVISCHDQTMGPRDLSKALNAVSKGFRGRAESFEMNIQSSNGNRLKSGICARIKVS